jgi:hypothetical protein
MPLAAGARFGAHEIVAFLGAGGMGEVWRARDTRLEREVALKVLPPTTIDDETARARLLREARLASRLDHPHVCTIHEVGEAEGRPFVAMELVEGRSLSELLSRGPLPTEQVLRLGQRLADALAHAHEHGVVHRDFKSANVVLTPEGRAKVLDFGLARRLAGEDAAEATTASYGSLTSPGTLPGTLAYMAPEQLRGHAADARSDIWALGVVLYEMVSGRRPFDGQTGFALSSAILNEPVPALPPGIPDELRRVIERCLAKGPAERYQRAAEVRAALEALASGSGDAAGEGKGAPTTAPAVARRRTGRARRGGDRRDHARPRRPAVAPPSEAVPRTKEAALKALSLDETLAEAHHVLAVSKDQEWDFRAAEREYERALELEPNDADGLAMYSHYLEFTNRPDEAMVQIDRALSLDPFNVNTSTRTPRRRSP